MKAICEKGMVKHFKKDNIFEILNLADRFNAKNLKVETLVCLRMYIFYTTHCVVVCQQVVTLVPVRRLIAVFLMLAILFRAMS